MASEKLHIGYHEPALDKTYQMKTLIQEEVYFRNEGVNIVRADLLPGSRCFILTDH